MKPQSLKSQKTWMFGFLVVLLVFVGYHEYFWGANAFFKEDWVAVSSHTFGNKYGNGWRADRGFGISNYFGDPAMWHPWGPLSWLEKISPSQAFAYNFTVILFSVIVALAVFVAIRRMYPSFSPLIAAMLAPAVIFSTDQSAYYLARAFAPYIASIPLVILILFQFFETKKPVYYFYFSLMAFAVTFLGNIWCLTQMLSVGFFFTCGYCYYFKKSFIKHLQSLMILYAFTGLSTLLVGAWAFYSFILEKLWVGYVREKTFMFNTSLMPDWKGLMGFIPGIFLAEYMPQNNFLAGFWGRQPYMNFLPFFVMIFWLSFKINTKTFWSFIVRLLLSVFFIHQLIMYSNFPPLLGRIIQHVSNLTSKLIVFYDFIFPLQMLLVVDFLIALRDRKDEIGRSVCLSLSQFSAWVAIMCYGFVFVLVMAAYWNSTALKNVMLAMIQILPEAVLPGGREFIQAIIDYNVSRLTETYQPYAVFYLISAVIVCLPFLYLKGLEYLRRLPLKVLAGIILCNAFLLSWGIFPSNRTPLFWEKLAQKENITFNSTDRFYFVKDHVYPRALEAFESRWSNVDGQGYKQRILGIEQTPGLNMSGFKSFTTKQEKEFVDQIFNSDGEVRVTKRLYYGGPLIQSDLINMAAVNYYFSENKLTGLSSGIESVYDTKGLHIYKNLNAWPYYYLAKRLEVVDGPIKQPVRDTAYLFEQDIAELSDVFNNGTIDLKQFQSGKMLFEYKGSSNNLLVIADAWHPLWRARKSSGEELKVVKVNIIFKGIRLPAGEYQLEVFFDPQPYLPGVWISLVSGILFSIAFVITYCSRDRLAG